MTLLPEDAEANVRLLYHRDVVGAVADGRSDRFPLAILYQANYLQEITAFDKG